jgi:hypothetical protein
MNTSREFLAAHFDEVEVDAIKSGYSLPTGTLGIDKLIFRRVSRSTLGKICVIAAEEKTLPHSYGAFGGSDRMNIYSLINDYPLNDYWSIHIDFGAIDDGEDKPITDAESISAVEVCLSPKENLHGALDDFGYEGQLYTRKNYFDDWVAGNASPIDEQVELLHLLGQKITLQ